MNILNSVKKDQQSFFTHTCYQILCNEIKYYCLNKLIEYYMQIINNLIKYYNC